MIREAGGSIGFFALPCLGEVECGDDCFIRSEPERVFLALIDGAGHGTSARAVADKALELLAHTPPCVGVEGCLRSLHQHLRGTSGAALALVDLRRETDRWVGQYGAVGDMTLLILGARRRRLPVSDGIVGVVTHSQPVHALELNRGDRLLVTSDGIEPGFEGSLLPGSIPARPLELARKVVFEHQLGHDDSSCLVFLAP